jgi:hypothetical protein
MTVLSPTQIKMRFRLYFFSALILLPVVLCGQVRKNSWSNQDRESILLRVSSNGRYLEYYDGTPFLWLGDTAWELFHRLSREEADLYLENRARKGFTVIQAVILAELEGESKPNAYGEFPLINKDPARPNEAYFKHVDYIIEKAASLGLHIGILPTWGIYWKTRPENTRRLFTSENAAIYGEFLGQRYKDKPVIWILGGDQNPENDQEKAILESMARGLRKGDKGNHLITFHPRGPGRSSDYFHNSSWLDLNMYQSSHAAKGFDNGIFAELDYKLFPVKPTLDGEPRYENMMVGFYFQGNHPADKFTSYDARTAAYWSLLAGACGHTYGNNNIWQMWREGEKNVIGANIPWYEAIDHPGSLEMMHLRRFFESREWQKLRPAQDLIIDGPETGPAKIRAAIAEDRSFMVVYSPMGEPFTMNLDSLKSNYISDTWFDPRYGTFFSIHQGDVLSVKTFTPPTSGQGNDWILVIDVNK